MAVNVSHGVFRQCGYARIRYQLTQSLLPSILSIFGVDIAKKDDRAGWVRYLNFYSEKRYSLLLQL